jgi:hypothetical protein
MRTEKQIEASRANGCSSHGPVTPEGKRRSSQNALRHGLLAATVVLQHEDTENFQTYLEEHIERFQPADYVEMNVVEEMVAATWRLHRSWALQTRLLDKEIDTHTGEEVADAMAASVAKLAAEPGLALLQRYETRLHLVYHRCIATLARLRASRRSSPAAPSLPNEPNIPVPGRLPSPAPAPVPGPWPPHAALPNEPNRIARNFANPPSPHPVPPARPEPGHNEFERSQLLQTNRLDE